MAQITGEVSGFVIDVIDDVDTRADDLDPISAKLLDAYKANQRGQFKAAAAHAVDAVNMIAGTHSINCGADM